MIQVQEFVAERAATIAGKVRKARRTHSPRLAKPPVARPSRSSP
jgi:hypothetical protein